MDHTFSRFHSLENVIIFYQTNHNVKYNDQSISDIFSEFFDYDLNAIDAWIKNQFRCKVLKNNITSAAYRKQGNLFFIEKNLHQSLKLYTKSLCYALPLSNEYNLSLANRSAVTFETENYEECLRDIDRCLASNYPRNLRPKLLLRKAECLKNLRRPVQFETFLNEICTFFNNLSLVEQDKYIEKYERLRNSRVGEIEQNGSTESVCPMLNFGIKENPEFAYASSKIEVRYSPVKGRHVVAQQYISTGEILFLEKAFTFSPIFDVETRDINPEMCYHCLKNTLSGIPCDSCVQCVFCDTSCKELSWKEYHKWECMGMQTDLWYHLGIALPAFKTFCKGINSSVRRDQDLSIEKRICFGDKSNNYPYFDSLVYHIRENNIGSIICSAILVEYLSKYTNFFQSYLIEPNCPEKNLVILKKYVGSCIAKHILQLENNSTVIEHWIDVKDGLPSRKEPVACGIFPSVSMMNHSCRPNISNYFIHDTIIVKALDNIEQNSEIFNCYGVDYRAMRIDERQKQIRDLYNFECKCVICNDHTNEMEMFDTFRCTKCGYNISDNEDQSFCYCGNCKAKIDLNQLREMNAKIVTILEGEIEEVSLLHWLNRRKQFLSEKHSDLQDTYYKLYQLYAKKAEFNELMTYFELWMKNEKTRIGENAQNFGNILYEIGSLMIENLKPNKIRSEKESHLLEKAHFMLREAKTISSLYYPDYFIAKIKWE